MDHACYDADCDANSIFHVDAMMTWRLNFTRSCLTTCIYGASLVELSQYYAKHHHVFPKPKAISFIQLGRSKVCTIHSSSREGDFSPKHNGVPTTLPAFLAGQAATRSNCGRLAHTWPWQHERATPYPPRAHHCAGWSAVRIEWHIAPTKAQIHNTLLRAADLWLAHACTHEE